VAGTAAAAAWAALVVQTGTLFDVLSPGIGVAVGVAIRFAMARGSKGGTLSESDAETLGFVAGLVTLASVLGGKIAFLSALFQRHFGDAATWEAIRAPFFTSLIGIRGLYLLIAVAAAYGIVARGAKIDRRAGSE
jgi:hypothetical protein